MKQFEDRWVTFWGGVAYDVHRASRLVLLPIAVIVCGFLKGAIQAFTCVWEELAKL